MSVAQPKPLSRKALLKSFGTISYQEGYRLQEDFHQKVKSSELPAVFLVLEHTPVLTLGKHADMNFVLLDASEMSRRGIDCIRTDRGGEVTAHMPGQIVVYPILPVTTFGLGAREYVNALMQAVIKTLAKWGIKARCDAEFPGVWVGSNKICAVGVRIKERVSLHGIALNVNNSLELFKSIVPCGIQHLGVTSLAQELGHAVSDLDVRNELCQRLSEALSIDIQS